MVLAIEPMTTAGRAAVRVAGDGWAIFSQDDSLAAHFEFTVAITARGPPRPHAVACCCAGARCLGTARRRGRDGGIDSCYHPLSCSNAPELGA